MRHIQKSEEPPASLSAWTAQNSDQLERKFQRFENKKLSADKVWEFLPSNPEEPGKRDPAIAYFSKHELREILLLEQGGICCYCGSRISHNHHTRLDHLDPKTKHIRKTFDYHNLAAACSGGVYQWHTVQAGETLEEIAMNYQTTAEEIEKLNREIDLTQITSGIELEIRVKEVESHCDVAKKDEHLPVKPTEKGCEKRFSYSSLDGSITGDEDAVSRGAFQNFARPGRPQGSPLQIAPVCGDSVGATLAVAPVLRNFEMRPFQASQSFD